MGRIQKTFAKGDSVEINVGGTRWARGKYNGRPSGYGLGWHEVALEPDGRTYVVQSKRIRPKGAS